MTSEPPKMNLANPEFPDPPQRPQHCNRRPLRNLLLYTASLFFVVLMTFGYQILFADHVFFPFANLPIFRALRSLVRSSDLTLRGEGENRINILLLGMGGAGHEGPYLTDTIMLASIEPRTRRLALVSIPRDLVMPLGRYGWRKVNTANAFGEVERPGQGSTFVADMLGDLLQLPIHYYVRVDFDGFQKLIDDLGGVIITVERNFVDTKYPTHDFKTQTIRFDAGPQRFTGERALQYVRSRHGSNREGSDFARARRQQRLMHAVKDRLFSLWTLTSPSVLSSLVRTFEQHVSTNMNLGEMVRFARVLQGIDTDTVRTAVLDTGPNGYLKETRVNNAFLLEPLGGTFDDIRTFIAEIFTKIDEEETPTPEPPATVDVRNGTRINGLARTVADRLKREGFIILYVANAPEQGYRETVVIDHTDGIKQRARDQLKTMLGTATTFLSVPLEQKDSASASMRIQTQADFLIILGQDQTGITHE